MSEEVEEEGLDPSSDAVTHHLGLKQRREGRGGVLKKLGMLMSTCPNRSSLARASSSSTGSQKTRNLVF